MIDAARKCREAALGREQEKSEKEEGEIQVLEAPKTCHESVL